MHILTNPCCRSRPQRHPRSPLIGIPSTIVDHSTFNLLQSKGTCLIHTHCTTSPLIDASIIDEIDATCRQLRSHIASPPLIVSALRQLLLPLPVPTTSCFAYTNCFIIDLDLQLLPHDLFIDIDFVDVDILPYWIRSVVIFNLRSDLPPPSTVNPHFQFVATFNPQHLLLLPPILTLWIFQLEYLVFAN